MYSFTGPQKSSIVGPETWLSWYLATLSQHHAVTSSLLHSVHYYSDTGILHCNRRTFLLSHVKSYCCCTQLTTNLIVPRQSQRLTRKLFILAFQRHFYCLRKMCPTTLLLLCLCWHCIWDAEYHSRHYHCENILKINFHFHTHIALLISLLQSSKVKIFSQSSSVSRKKQLSWEWQKFR